MYVIIYTNINKTHTIRSNLWFFVGALQSRENTMATKKERDFFEKNILAVIAANSSKLDNSKLTGFLSMKGKEYDSELMVEGKEYKSELMVVGHSVNGWMEKGTKTPSELNSKNARSEYAADAYDSATKDNDPMGWVTARWGSKEGYNTKRSAFWRVIRSTSGKLGIADIEQKTWSSHLVWSNLYKVSPAEGGKPNTALRKCQHDTCRKLLEMEISNYTPKRLLFLTGLNWAKPFLENICSVKRTNQKYVEGIGNITCDTHTTRVVVAKNPGRKKEEKWVQQVIKAFNA